jgi:hypothetical protein
LKDITKKNNAKRKFSENPVSKQIEKQKMSATKLNRKFQEQVDAAYDSLGERPQLEPNPFLFSRIEQRLNETGNSTSEGGGITVKRVLQPALLTILIILALIGGIRIGSIGSANAQTTEKFSTEYLLNDINQEHIESTLMKE